MVYGETGRYSIYINTKLRILYFWNIVTVMIMVFNATFNNISVISWRSVLLVEDTGENHRPVASLTNLINNVVSSNKGVLIADIYIRTSKVCLIKFFTSYILTISLKCVL
jgi:hypothetical protein